MFEGLLGRARGVAERRARLRAADLAARLRIELPRGIEAVEGADGVTLSGRGLSRRFALEPALRWLLAGLPFDLDRQRR